jgi:hypothetical protein
MHDTVVIKFGLDSLYAKSDIYIGRLYITPELSMLTYAG